MIKTLAPGAIDDQIWLYLDILLPTFLPVLDTKNKFLPVTAAPPKKPTTNLVKTYGETTNNPLISSDSNFKNFDSTTTYSMDVENTKPIIIGPESTTSYPITFDRITSEEQTPKIMFDDGSLTTQELNQYYTSYPTITEDIDVDSTYLAPRRLKVRNSRGILK